MAFEHKELTGSLFKNKDKTDANPSWADYQGKLMVNGQLYYLSAWVKRPDGKEPFFSLALKPVEEKQASQQDRHEPVGDDQIPF